MPTAILRSFVTVLAGAVFLAAGIIRAQQAQSPLGEMIAQDERLARFAALLDSAGLLDMLNDAEAAFTVFAPVDEALDPLSETVQRYLDDNPALLRRILMQHLVAEPFQSDAVLEQPAITSLEGGILTTDTALRRINGATLIETDIPGTNGVLHVIDGLLMPEIVMPLPDPFINFESILTAGSSTVRPLTERMGDEFLRAGFSGTITVEETGTNVGLERFCVNAESDIANASRPIRESEIEACRANGREPIEFFVAVDALAVVVSRENTFLEDLSIEHLGRIFSGEFTRWNQIDAAYPDAPIQAFSPGDDSGTFVYFVESVLMRGLGLENDAAEAAIMNAPTIRFSEDDNVLVTGVEASETAIGYFGFAYYLANQDRLRVVSIEGTTPNEATAESGEYPLSRPLFIYSSPDVMREKPQVAEFINYYINNVAQELGTDDDDIGYFPVNRDVLNLDRLEWLAASR